MTARARSQPVSAKEISDKSGIKRNTVDKYLLRLLRKGTAERFPTVHGYFRYQASDRAESWTNLGGVPRYYLNDVLDIENVRIEDRKAKIHLMRSHADIIRSQCKEAGKRDRAQWRSYEGSGFACAISKNGVFRLTVHDVHTWQGAFRKWLENIGFYSMDIERIISDLSVSFASGQGRIEYPIKTPLLRESKISLEVVTIFKDEVVRSNINRSCSQLGFEISGSNWFLDMVTTELATLSHKIASQLIALQKARNENIDYIG